MDLIEFLRIRLDEDEQYAAESIGREWELLTAFRFSDPADKGEIHLGEDRYVATPNVETARHIALHDPARVLREVEGKREIIEDCEGTILGYVHAETRDRAVGVLRNLASIWSDHPDYQEEWRP